MDALMASL